LLSGINILVAEDNLLNQRVLSFIFQREGAQVDYVTTGRMAVDKLTVNNYDIVLMDLHMPEMDGLEAAKYIRETMKNNVPIVGITAGSFSNENEDCMSAGMNACIYKPFESQSLCNLIIQLTPQKRTH
jgi:CheY-like chemotaxis protein